MRINPIEAVRKITSDITDYTRQIFERRRIQEQHQKMAQEAQTKKETQVQFDEFLEKVPANHKTVPAAAPSALYQDVVLLAAQPGNYEQSASVTQRVSTAQKAYELSMIGQTAVEIAPFDSRA